MPSVRSSLLVVVILVCAIGHAADERLSVVPHPLITKDRVQLNLAGAELVLSAAKQKAATMGWKMNLAVVDDGGHLVAFARMDGARPASATTAMTKAVSAATFRQET